MRDGFGRNIEDGTVSETALSPRLRPHAEYATACEGDCARAKSNFPSSFMENNPHRGNAESIPARERAREFA